MKKFFTLFTLLLLTMVLPAQNATWFTDITDSVGMDSAIAMRIHATDLNNDDYPDLVLVENYNQRDLIRVYLNQQNPASQDTMDRIFVDITAYSGVNIHPDYPDSTRRSDIVCLADINNDGNVDLVSGIWHWSLATVNYPNDRPCVMLGDGTGKFSHVPNDGLESLGLISISGFSFLDYNLDGNLDLYIGTFSQDHPANYFVADHLMRGNGDGTFTDVTSPFDIGVAKEPEYGVSAVDWNNDGWTDILTSPYCRSGGILWRNNSGFTFSNQSFAANYNAQFMLGDTARDLCQWGAFPYDFDNDGDMDVLHVLVHGGIDPGEGRTVLAVNGGPAQNYKLTWDLSRLIRNNPQSYHLGNMDATWFDMDNDMLVDMMYTETVYQPATDRAFFFHQNPSHYLNDITDSLGLMWVKSPHAVESFDLDLDGDYDMIINRNNIGNKVLILRNNIGTSKNWIGVKLIAPNGVNHNCIGARVIVYSGGVRQMREIHAGVGHFAGQQPFIITFGLADNAVVDSLVVNWPSTTVPPTVLTHPEINKINEVEAQTVGLDPTFADPWIVAFPNPASQMLNVGGPGLEGMHPRFELYDLLGNQVLPGLPQQLSHGTWEISLDGIPNGLYVLTASDPRHDLRWSTRLMVRK
ncbi:MAG: VCBS repeat-containing protein [Bacteroidia bacterium]|nr:VCBS repeat-containing protein [Bacteroidia bacterium]